MSSIKVKSRDGYMPSGFKANYIEKVTRLDNGFHKTVEKVMCPRSHAVKFIFFICPNEYAQIHTSKFIRPNAYAHIHTPKFILCIILKSHTTIQG